MHYAVGMKMKGRSSHTVVDAEDALVAALKVKVGNPEALITYVRRENRRGDTRNPAGHLAQKRD